MKVNEIIQANNIIALYMGAHPYGDKNHVFLPHHCVCRTDAIDAGNGKILRYHESWDWLIPVIDKIRSMDSYPMYVSQSNMIGDSSITINTKFIRSTYKEVVEFIKWHNAIDSIKGLY